MTYIRPKDNTWPYALSDLRRDFPNVSFAAEPTADDLAPFGVFPVIPTDAPPYDPPTERIEEVSPEEVKGEWLQRWQVVPLTPEEQAEWKRANIVPRWVQFGVALGMSPAVNQFVATLAQAAPVLHLMIGVGLGQAAQGDPKTFLGGWAQCRAAGLVSPQLLAGVVELASGFDLPEEFISALTADP